MSWRRKKDEREKNEIDRFPFDIFGDDFFSDDYFKSFRNEIEKFMTQFDSDNPNVVTKRFGPYYWGYQLRIGPDGKPEIKQFGNMPPKLNESQSSDGEKEPLIDIFVEDNAVKLLIELPGVSKEDIKVKATENKIIINATNENRKYKAEKELDIEIIPESVKSSYNNGILELVFDRKKNTSEKEFEVKID